MSGDTWTATYGSFAGQVRDRTVWLDEGPARWGGSWATGALCAHSASSSVLQLLARPVLRRRDRPPTDGGRVALAAALAGTNLYEAGGNIFWLNPVIGSGDEQICSGEGQSWELAHAMADPFRLNDGAGASTPCTGTLAKERRQRFTVTFPVRGDKVDVFGADTLWGWHLAAFEAAEVGLSYGPALQQSCLDGLNHFPRPTYSDSAYMSTTRLYL